MFGHDSVHELSPVPDTHQPIGRMQENKSLVQEDTND